jgi:hypothetical protein
MIRRALSRLAGVSESGVARGMGGPVALSDLPAGSEATLAGGLLPADEMRLLAAMGLSDRSFLRVCRQGEPCIVESRSVRVGISRAVARRLHTEPTPR